MNHLLEDHTAPELVDLFHSIESQDYKSQQAQNTAELLKEAVVETLSDKYPGYLPYVGVIREQEGSCG